VLGVCAGVIDDGQPNGSHRLGFAPAAGTCYPGNGKRVGRAGAAARARGHGLGGLLAHGAVLLEDLGGHAEEFHLHGVGVGDEAAHEVVRAAGNRREALAQHAAGATFGH